MEGEQGRKGTHTAEPPNDNDTKRYFHLFIQTVSKQKRGEKQLGYYWNWIWHLSQSRVEHGVEEQHEYHRPPR